MKSTLWKQWAPEGPGWERPTGRPGGLERETALQVMDALHDRAVRLYWARRPVPVRRPETVGASL